MTSLPNRLFFNKHVENSERWIIPGVLPKNSIAMVTGRSGVGKSFIVIDALSAIAANGESVFGGVRENSGAVVHVCLESPDDMFRRYLGTMHKYGKNFNVYSFSEFDATDTSACANFAYQLNEEHKDAGVSIIAYSTLTSIAPGVDENSVDAMKHVISNLNVIRELTGATQLIEHHTSLSSDRPRGHSVIDGLMHTMINVAGTKSGMTVSCTKQRVARKFDPFRVELRDVEFDSTPIKPGWRHGVATAHLERVNGTAQTPATETSEPNHGDLSTGPAEALTGNARAVFEFAEHNGGVSWREIEPLAVMSKKTFYRAVESLSTLGLIVNVGNGVYSLADDM